MNYDAVANGSYVEEEMHKEEFMTRILRPSLDEARATRNRIVRWRLRDVPGNARFEDLWPLWTKVGSACGTDDGVGQACVGAAAPHWFRCHHKA
jgi:hypothetical protein